MYLATGKGCHNLVHLNLSGCTQMTVNGFRYISAGCRSLKDIVINDMPTLSDSCVLALIARCHSLSVVSLLDAPHISDVALKAIAEVAKLKTFRMEGNNQLTDTSWTALCSSSQGLRRLHAAQCPRMTDASLKCVAKLTNLQHLDISLCNKCMTDMAVQYLTSGSQYLRELDASGCVLLTDRSIRRLERVCPPLGSISMVCCSSISNTVTFLTVELSTATVSHIDINVSAVRGNLEETIRTICRSGRVYCPYTVSTCADVHIAVDSAHTCDMSSLGMDLNLMTLRHNKQQ
ncbi:F-box/LRR-repeat protein 13 [Liparis tanakae]|uniref:F-box/LRR-repeat protein 13 n=1 Tax=Liparis tanakae TaxID=230148 RepID=A0A4Z2HZB4_9TELE|nr:F-box/LRR-repeat protein 13 [Liparis tanakae]